MNTAGRASDTTTIGARRLSRRRGWLVGVAFLAVVLLGVWLLTLQTSIVEITPPPGSAFAEASVARGANVAAIGNCAGCHSAPDASPFAGGLPLATPFGTIYSTNITPSAERGIGRWSRGAFERAMREGVSRDGHLLYPAFPYDHFTRTSEDDLAALYAFVMTRTPVDAKPPPNALRFPFGFRPLLAGWNLLFLDRRPFALDTSRSAEWNRGAYLADALAHCSACHSPRNALGAEKRHVRFAGGEAEGWYSPPLNADSPSPQPWTVPTLTEYLRTGLTSQHAIAGGPMQGVTASLGDATAADVQAIATYIVSTMGPPSPAQRQRSVDTLARARQPLVDAAPASDPALALGATVYADACASCHDAGRRVSSNGALQMPLAVAVHDADPRSLLRIVRDGIGPPDGARGRVMPAFNTALTDEQLTALAAYLRRVAADAPPWADLADVVRATRGPAGASERQAKSSVKEPA